MIMKVLKKQTFFKITSKSFKKKKTIMTERNLNLKLINN